MPMAVDRVKLTRAQDRRAKVTDEQVAEMRRLYDCGSTQKALASMFHISQPTVSYIVSEKARARAKEYRKQHPSRRRTPEEATKYMRELRKYKKEILKKAEDRREV